MSAGLIVAGQDFYETVGYPEATTILASFAALLGILPFVFARAGPRIRQRSRYSLEVRDHYVCLCRAHMLILTLPIDSTSCQSGS